MVALCSKGSRDPREARNRELPRPRPVRLTYLGTDIAFRHWNGAARRTWANSGEPWSEMDIADLTHSLAYGNPVADAASMLCRDEDEVRQKAKRLRLVEHPGSASVVR